MVAGMNTFTFAHVVISVIGIISGLVILFGLLTNRRMDGSTLTFLVFTVATSVTGFFFPFHGVTPAVILGVLSLIVLLPTILARYPFAMRGPWRGAYVIGAVIALYFNCFVLVVQLFLKVPPLHALAPKGSEPPFAVAQGLVLLFFLIAGFLSFRRFRPRH
jgi:hypothetical protein